MKAALRGVRHGQMAEVNRIEGSAKKGDRWPRAVRGFPRGGSAIAEALSRLLRGHCAAPCPGDCLPASPVILHARHCRQLPSTLFRRSGCVRDFFSGSTDGWDAGGAGAQAVRAPRPWREPVPGFPLRWRRRWREIRGRASAQYAARRSRRARSTVASSLVATTMVGLAASSGLKAANSPQIISKSRTGSRSEASLVSTRCAIRRVRSICFRNRVPSPAPSWAPSIRPGKIRDDESAADAFAGGAVRRNHAQMRLERGERIIRNFGMRGGNARNQRGFAGIRESPPSRCRQVA